MIEIINTNKYKKRLFAIIMSIILLVAFETVQISIHSPESFFDSFDYNFYM